MSVGDYTLLNVIIGLCEEHTILQQLTGWKMKHMERIARNCDECYVMDDDD